MTLLICFLSYAVINTVFGNEALPSISLNTSIISLASNLSRSSIIITTLQGSFLMPLIYCF